MAFVFPARARRIALLAFVIRLALDKSPNCYILCSDT